MRQPCNVVWMWRFNVCLRYVPRASDSVFYEYDYVWIQKLLLPSTMRRLGEEILEPRPATSQPQQQASCSHDVFPSEQSFDGQFFHSHDIHVRLLSTLIILRTINQGTVTDFWH